MTTWTPDTSIPSDSYSSHGGTFYVIEGYVLSGYFAEQSASTSWSPESDVLTTWTSEADVLTTWTKSSPRPTTWTPA